MGKDISDGLGGLTVGFLGSLIIIIVTGFYDNSNEAGMIMSVFFIITSSLIGFLLGAFKKEEIKKIINQFPR